MVRHLSSARRVNLVCATTWCTQVMPFSIRFVDDHFDDDFDDDVGDGFDGHIGPRHVAVQALDRVKNADPDGQGSETNKKTEDGHRL